jgi:DNA polymerase
LQHDRAELADILAFYAEAGVDCALSDDAPNRFTEPRAGAPAGARDGASSSRTLPRSPSAPPEPNRAAEPPRPGLVSGAMSAEEAAGAASSLARACGTLDALREAMAGFEGCALKATAKSLCFSDGDPAARIMMVGEAPGADEDRQGLPFVGVSGQLLDRMLAAIGLDRSRDVYIANIVPWRPPGNRTPTTQEMMICKPFILRQIELAAPDILVTLGGPSTQALLGVAGIMAARGKWRSLDLAGRSIPALPTLHPAYLLRNPIAKRQSWADLRSLRRALDALPARG